MKRLIVSFALLFSALAHATTFTPLSLISPIGSTAGQVIASTGASSAPAWTTVTLSGLTGTVAIANGGTGATTAAAARTALGAAATSSPLTQFAATTSAQLAGVISDETGSGSLVFATGSAINPTSIGATTPGSGAFTTLNATGLITPSSTVGIKGTATNDAAQAGSIGQVVTSTGSVASLSTNTPTTITSISLTPGDWQISGSVALSGSGGAISTNAQGGISTTTNTFGAFGSYSQLAATLSANAVVIMPLPTMRQQFTATTTVFCVADSIFSAGAVASSCVINATRAR